MPWCGLEKLDVGVSASWSSTRKRCGPAKSSACAKEEAYRVSGDLKEQIVPVGDVGAPGKEYSAACKVAMILRTAKYIASLALFFSTVPFFSAVFAQRPSSHHQSRAPQHQ